MKRKVNVRKTDIKKGECGHSAKCAVARAMNRDCKDVGTDFHVFGGTGTYFPHGEDRTKTYLLPKKVQTFVNLFDMGGSVQPFTFCVNL